MWPFSDRIEKPKPKRQWWQKTGRRKEEPTEIFQHVTFREKLTSTYIPIAYLVVLANLVYLAWRRKTKLQSTRKRQTSKISGKRQIQPLEPKKKEEPPMATKLKVSRREPGKTREGKLRKRALERSRRASIGGTGRSRRHPNGDSKPTARRTVRNDQTAPPSSAAQIESKPFPRSAVRNDQTTPPSSAAQSESSHRRRIRPEPGRNGERNRGRQEENSPSNGSTQRRARSSLSPCVSPRVPRVKPGQVLVVPKSESVEIPLLGEDSSHRARRTRMPRRSSLPNGTETYNPTEERREKRRRARSFERKKKETASVDSRDVTEEAKEVAQHLGMDNEMQPPGEVVLDMLHQMAERRGSLGSLNSSVSAISRDIGRLQATMRARGGSASSSVNGTEGSLQLNADFEKLRDRLKSIAAQSSSRSLASSSTGTTSNEGQAIAELLATRRGSVGAGSLGSSQSTDRVAAFLNARKNGGVSSDGSSGGRYSAGFSSGFSGSKRSLSSENSSLEGAFYDPSSDAPPYLTIYYGTQSGTSEYYAYSLQQEGEAMGLEVGICNVSNLMQTCDTSNEVELSDVLVPHLSKSGKKRGRAVFLMSTYNDGGPTDDARTFLEALQEIDDHKYLKGLRFAVFGFGNSAYRTTYNLQGKLYDRLLAALGGRRLVPVALGDDSKDIDWEFEQWKWKTFWPKFADLSAKDCQPAALPEIGGTPKEPAENGQRTEDDDDPDVEYVLEYVSREQAKSLRQGFDDIQLQPASRHFRSGTQFPVTACRALWRDRELPPALSDQPGSTMHMELGIPEQVRDEISTGENLAILPTNSEIVVESLAEHLNFDLEAYFVLHQKEDDDAEFEIPFPLPCSVRDYLTRYCELNTPPRRSVVRALSKCATDVTHSEELHKLSSKKQRNEFMTRIVKENIGLADFITSYYPSIEISLAKFVCICTPLQARWYTASSSNLMHPNSVHLTFSVSSIRRSDGSMCLGTASHYLANLRPGDSVQVIRTSFSGFVAPKDAGAPVILIANGTGIAPMRALLQERHFQKLKQQVPVGPSELFFGIRRRDLDFLYQDEFASYKQAGTLSAMHLACSREQMHKIYVQHLVAKQSEHVWKLIQRGAHVYVCGSSRMQAEVDQVLRAIVSRKLKSGPNSVVVNEFLKNLEKDGRYVQEAFDANHNTASI